MAKQNTVNVTTLRTREGVIKGKKRPVLNADGFEATARKAKGELFLLGAGRFFGEESFYEGADEMSKRYVDLIHKVTKSDHEWVAAFLQWLRTDGNIRTAAIVGAAEYVFAGGPNGRAVVKSVLIRADEPAEMLAYWLKAHGRKVPQPIKRGIADSAKRLYNERNFAKWNGTGGVQMADVVELTHPKPLDNSQSDLFRYMIENRHGRATFEGKNLPNLEARSKARTRRDWLELLKSGNSTVSWENVSSAGKGSMSANEWFQCYKHMGYMAKLRNLRNLDATDATTREKRAIGVQLADKDNVGRSRQLPMRFYSAYRNVSDDVWKGYLQEALDHSLNNIPVLEGKWLVLVDASGSMGGYWSNDGKPSYYDNACVFGAAFAKVNGADLYTFSNDLSPKVPTSKNVLAIVNDMSKSPYWIGGGTNTASALEKAWTKGKYDGVVIVTDEAYNGYGYWGHSNPGDVLPANVPLYTFNIAGYGHGHNVGENRVTVGGLSDAAFTMIAAVESGKAAWPWE